ncbi:hypothetical protein IWW36_004012 [Coemansia brasiliensis]|uniref:mannan endo-1,4-beta-mannosidase n=1 Tax=Coemansia brasiliensis TaxID=2650707 RepID=A0A9W8LZ76_9FUNG|nr:hypothetical protein IWW36_004012 [Coemansia brasiliensis]
MDIVREIVLWTAAVSSLVTISTVSTIQFIVSGPMLPTWDRHTQLSRDLMRFLATSSSESPLLRILGVACFKYWPIVSQILQPVHSNAHISELTIPAYPLSPAVLENAGLWKQKLTRVAQESQQMLMEAERIVSTDSDHIILYMHGGAYTSGTARQYRNVHLRFAQTTGMQILGFSYRLAPQAQYPTQLYDAYCAYMYVRDLGFSDGQIVFAGDSAGGNLALALWQLLRAPVHALVLLSPRVDVTSTRNSWTRNAQVDVLHPYALDNPQSTICQLLAPEGLSQHTYQLLTNPFIAPIHADLTQLPPILMQVGTAEVMLDDIIEFTAQAQIQSSNTVELQQYENMFHVFQAGLPGTRHFKEAWERIAIQVHAQQRVMALSAKPRFVTAQGTRLVLDDHTFVVNGANYWQAMNLGMASGPSSNRTRVLQDLSELSRAGVNMVRILASSEGSQFGIQPDRMYPVLMTAPEQYNEDVFAGLDWVLAQLPRFGIKAAVSLNNYWTWSGGAAQYVSWATNSQIPYPKQWDHLHQTFTDGDYNEFLAYTNRFYADKGIYNTTQHWFYQHIKRVVHRVNTVTHIRYCDDPAIMVWELMNEPQVIEGGEKQMEQWINDSAQLIHQLDPNHLITSGAESKNGRNWHHIMHASPYISLLSCHFWPLNWGYYNATDPTQASLDFSVSKMHEFVQDNALWARNLNKPTVLFEFGMMRDNWGKYAGLLGYSPDAPVTHRNAFYKAVYEAVAKMVQKQQFSGAAFWAYSGTARPPLKPTSQISWTGDPPHEPPGWNSVYDQDTHTLGIIRNFASLCRQVLTT